ADRPVDAPARHVAHVLHPRAVRAVLPPPDEVPRLAARGARMNVLVAFGTRPEAIKLAPVIHELRRRPQIELTIVTTAQHRQLLDQVLDVFAIAPDADLDVMQPDQTLAELSGRVLSAIDRRLVADRPDLVLVQGDTTSALMCGLAAFYRRVAVGHVEAG